MPRLHQSRRGLRDSRLLAPVATLFFVQRRISHRRRVDGQGAAVRPLEGPAMMKVLEVLADGDQRSGEAPGQVLDHHAPVALHQLDNFSPTLLVEHGSKATRKWGCFVFFLFVIILLLGLA